jgi:hypothetical protein
MVLSHCESIEALRLHLNSVHNPDPPLDTSYDRTFESDPTKSFIRRVHCIRNFTHLRELRFVAEDDEGWVVSDFLPLRSATTLTSFTFAS